MKKLILLLLFVVAFSICAFAGDNSQAINWGDVSFGPPAPFVHVPGTDLVTWQQMNNCTGARRAACGWLGDYFYMWGDQSVCTSQAFNLNTNTWAPSTPPPYGYCNIGGVPAGSYYYLVGNYTSGYNNYVQRFSPTAGGPTGTWTQMAVYPQLYCGVSVAYDGGDYIYAGGGGSVSSAYAYKYSISGNNWTAIANLPGTGNKYAGGAFCGGKFHIVGGTLAPYNLHYAYDPATNTWSTLAATPTPVAFALFAASNNTAMTYLYIVGGGGGYGSWLATDAVQTYDAGANAWSLETAWPVANVGLNSAAYVGDGNVMVAGGATGGSTNVTSTYRGVGFPDGELPTYDVEIALDYLSGSPIPPTGGTLNFDVIITSNETSSVTIDVWTFATLPNMSQYGPIINVNNATIGASATITRNRNQVVPAGAPSGNYTYDAYVGNYPSGAWDEDHFDFSKSAADNGGKIYTGWENWGESFDGAMDEFAPMSCNVMNASPNPFNPYTRIAFTLSEVGHATISVFDINGREVGKLVDGIMNAGNHSVGFDGSSLSSGVYFAVLRTDGFTSTQKLLLMK